MQLIARLHHLIGRQPRRIAVAAGASLVVPVLLLPGLRIDNAIDVWLPHDGIEYRQYQQFVQHYGGDEFVLVVASGAPMRSEPVRQRLGRLADALEKLPAVTRAQHVSHLPDFALEPYDGLLISADRRVAAILLQTRPLSGRAARRDLVAAVRQAISRYGGNELRYRLAGPPVMNAALDNASEHEAKVFFPLAFAVSVALLWVMTRSLPLALAPLAGAGATVLWTLGIMVAAGHSLNMVTMVIPSLLWVLSLSGAVHWIHAYRRRIAAGTPPRQALTETLTDLTPPCFTAVVTTAAGFMTLCVSGMGPIRDLGLFSAIGILLSLIFNMTMTPALLLLTTRAATTATAATEARLLGVLADRVAGRPKTILAGSMVLMAALTVSATGLKAESNVLRFFRDNAPIVRDYRFIAAHLAGVSTVEIDLRDDATAADDVTARRWEFGEAIRKACETLAGVGKVTRQTTSSSTRLSLYVTFMEARDFNHLVARVKAIVTAHRTPGVMATVTGAVVLLNAVQERLINTQVRSFSLAFVIVFAMIALLFRSVRLAALSVLPNVFPVLCVFGLMGALDLPLDTATVTIASIALGIAVDDTIHFLSRTRSGCAAGRGRRQAVAEAYATAGRPILWTSLVIAAGFFAVALSDFRPIMLFGLLSGTAMLAALAGDLVLLPALLLVGNTQEGTS